MDTKKIYKIQDLLSNEMVGKIFKTKWNNYVFEVMIDELGYVVLKDQAGDLIERVFRLGEILKLDFEEIVKRDYR